MHGAAHISDQSTNVLSVRRDHVAGRREVAQPRTGDGQQAAGVGRRVRGADAHQAGAGGISSRVRCTMRQSGRSSGRCSSNASDG